MIPFDMRGLQWVDLDAREDMGNNPLKLRKFRKPQNCKIRIVKGSNLSMEFKASIFSRPKAAKGAPKVNLS